MENVLRYKDFIATVRYSAEDETFVGRVEGVNSIVSFEGETIQELKNAFKEAIESYVDFCRRKGISEIQKSYSGAFNIRTNSDLHRRAAIAAKMHGKSLNAFVKRAIERELEYA